VLKLIGDEDDRAPCGIMTFSYLMTSAVNSTNQKLAQVRLWLFKACVR